MSAQPPFKHQLSTVLASKFYSLCGLAFLFTAAGGGVLVASQVVVWLDKGNWVSYPLILALHPLGIFDPQVTAWINNPNSWVGLHRLLEWLPLSSFLIIFGYLFWLVFDSMADDVLWREEERHKREARDA